MNRKLIVTASVAVATFVLGGCASTASDYKSASTGSDATAISAQKAELSRREAELMRSESKLEAERMRLEDARKELQSASTASPMGGAGDNSGLMPSNPKPGECYARVIIPAQYETKTDNVLAREASDRIEIIPARYETVKETVVVKEASSKLEVIPAQYETVKERVLVKPATTRLEVVPAVYETIEEQVLVRPASKDTIEVPAVYETVTERVQDQPARTEWKRGTGKGTGAGVALASATQTIQRFGDYKVLETRVEDTGDLMCLVEIPATFKTVSKQMLVKPATTRTIEKPAEYKTVSKKVLKTPAMTRSVEIPAEYRTVEVTKQVRPESTREVVIPAVYGEVSVTKLATPASERRIPVPAEYKTLSRKVKLSDERTEWRPVLCEVNMTRENVSALQSALNETGCCRCGPNRDECKIDGVMGQCTLQAAQCFANKKGVSSGDKYITMDVVRALGLKF